MKQKVNAITHPENKSGGIYAIINKDKRKIYIGETKNIRHRSKAHINLLKSGKHTCKELQEDYNNNSNIEIIELLEIPGEWNTEARFCVEDYYIACLQEKGIELYNNPRDKNCKDNFFILACRADKSITNIIKEIGIHENRPLTYTRK